MNEWANRPDWCLIIFFHQLICTHCCYIKIYMTSFYASHIHIFLYIRIFVYDAQILIYNISSQSFIYMLDALHSSAKAIETKTESKIIIFFEKIMHELNLFCWIFIYRKLLRWKHIQHLSRMQFIFEFIYKCLFIWNLTRNRKYIDQEKIQ